MPRKKKKYNLKSKLTSAIRRTWFFSPYRSDKVKQLKEKDNKCEFRGCKNEYKQIDHDIPVVPLTGFDNWENYIHRMFVGIDGLVGLCPAHHKAKTTVENKIRKKYRKKIDK